MNIKEKFNTICVAYVIADKLNKCNQLTQNDMDLIGYTKDLFTAISDVLSTYDNLVKKLPSANLSKLLDQEVIQPQEKHNQQRAQSRVQVKTQPKYEENPVDIAIGLAVTLPQGQYHSEPTMTHELEEQQIHEFQDMMSEFQDCDFGGKF